MRVAALIVWLAVLVGCSIGQGGVRGPAPAGLAQLSQPGSGELLPLPLAPELRGWDPEGEATVVQAEDGRAAIRLGPGGRFTVAAETRPHTLYVLRYEYCLSPDLVAPADPTKQALDGWFTPRDDKTGAVPIGGSDERSDRWHPVERYLFTPGTNRRVTVGLGFQGSAGSALVSALSLTAVAAPPAEGLHTATVGGRRWCELPSATAGAHAERGLPHAVADVGRLTHDREVDAGQPGQALARAACPGEVVVVGVGGAGPESAAVTALRSGNRAIEPAAIEILATAATARRTDYYGRGNTWHWPVDSLGGAPEGLSAGPRATTGFALRIRVPDDAAPGLYEGELAWAGARPLPIRLTVHPFRLAELAAPWALYTDFGRWRAMTDEQVLRELRDMREHGITSPTVPCRGRGTWTDGRLTAWAWDKEALRGMGLIRQSGMPGPFLLQLEKEIDDLAEELGLPETVMDGPPARRPAVLAGATEDLLRLIVRDYAARGWGEPVFVGVDEPGYWKEGSPERFAWEYARAAAAGISTYCTSSYLPSDPLGQNLTYHCYGGWLASRQRALRRVAESRSAGQEAWYYAAGCYPGQVGSVVRNRHAAGFLFWASGADGQAFWTFQRPRGDAFDDFSGETGQPCITLPNPDRPGESLDTPQWEGIRQAWYDARYARTLERALAAAEARGGAPAGALVEARALVRELRVGLPWSPEATETGEVTCERLDALRGRIAAAVEGLGAGEP